MSFPVWNLDASFNKITSSYFKDLIDLSGNFIIRNGTIKSPANTIEFDDTFSFINFLNSVNIYGQQKLTYNSIEYDVGERISKIQDIYDNKIGTMFYNTQYDFNEFNNIYCSGQIQYEDSSGNHIDLVPIVLNNASGLSIANTDILALQGKTTNISYNPTGTLTTIAGNLTFSVAPTMSGANISVGSIPINRVSGTAVNTNGAQNIVATKTFTVAQTFQNNIRLDGSLLVGTAGGTTITNTQLQAIPDISTLKTITTAISYTPATVTTLINNVLQFSGTLNGWNTTNFSNAINYAKDLTSSAQTQINNINGVTLSASNIFTGATNQFSNTLRLDGALNLNANALVVPNTTLQKLQYISTISSDIQTQTTTNATNINEGKDNLTILNTKNTDITYASSITTIANTLATSNITFSGNLNTIPSATFAFINSLTSNAQAQLTNLATKLTAISYESANTTTTIAGDLIFLNNLNSISATTFGYLSGLTSAIQTQLNSLSTSITTLNNLTGGFTRSSTTGTYTFSSNLNTSGNFNTLTPYEIGNLTSTTGNIQTQLNSKMDYYTGTIIQHAQASLQSLYPTRFLLCDGQEVSRSTYSALFTIIGSSYGIGNGSTTFNVPDYRACFLRMYSSARTVNGTSYSPNLPNVIQEDTLEEHEHHSNLSGNYLRSGTNTNTGYFTGAIKPNQSNFPEYTGGVTSTNRSSVETRPLNHSVYFYIIC